MSKFGQYAIIEDVEHHFEKEPDWWWKIKAPTSGDELAMTRYLSQNRVVVDRDGRRTETPPTWTEICHREIALCFAGTNIPKDGKDGKSVEEGGEPILKEGAKVDQVEYVLRQMPHPMVIEIWKAIGEKIPNWGAQRPNDSEIQSTTDE